MKFKEGDFIKFNVDKHLYGLFYGIVLDTPNNNFIKFKIIGTDKIVNLNKIHMFKNDGKMSEYIEKVSEDKVKYGIIKK